LNFLYYLTQISARENGLVAQHFFNAQQLVVLGHPVGPTG
jgi:hypothetical protein